MALAALRKWLVRGPRGGPDEAGPANGPAVGAAMQSDVAITEDESAARPGALASEPVPGRPMHWTPARITLEEELWGIGFLAPGGAAEVLRYANPMGLSASSTLLLVGAGAGGPPQTLATDLGVWVDAYEADPDLVELAVRRIQRAGAALAKRATVAGWDRAAPHFRPRAAHHGLAIEAVQDAVPEPVLAAIAKGLKPHGQLVLVETVAAKPIVADDAAITTWCRLEGRRPVLPAAETITNGLTRLGFDVRVEEDISARHMRLAVLGWKHIVRQMARARPTPERAAAVVAVAEMWTRRVRLMHAGDIRLMRWHAIGPGGAGPG